MPRADAERVEFEGVGAESYNDTDLTLEEEQALSQAELAADLEDIERSVELMYEEQGVSQPKSIFHL